MAQVTGMTDKTRSTLIGRVRDGEPAAWREFHELYASVLYRFVRSRGLSRADADEIRDQCMEILVRKMPTFEYDREKGGFKAYLRRIAMNKIVDRGRKPAPVQAGTAIFGGLKDEHPTPDEAWDKAWRKQHIRYCVDCLKDRVSPKTWQAFHLLVFEEMAPQDVAERLDMSLDQVYQSKSRMVKRIRDMLLVLDPTMKI